jgi:hypothetical protein
MARADYDMDEDIPIPMKPDPFLEGIRNRSTRAAAPPPDAGEMDPQEIYADPTGKVWHPHRGYWCWKTATALQSAEATVERLTGELAEDKLHAARDQRFIDTLNNEADGLLARAEKAEAALAEAREALRQISEGRGEFSLDHHQHAKNTIESMKEIALSALAPLPKEAASG